MAKGVDVDAVDEEGDTALYYAIKVLREECACCWRRRGRRGRGMYVV